MSNYGYHWSPCRGGGNGAAIITAIIALLVIGGGGMSAAASSVTSLLVVILVTLCAVAVLGIAVAVVVLVRRDRRTDAPGGIMWREVDREAVTAEQAPQVTAAPLRAIAPPQPVIINIFGADERAAALIRQALPAATAEIITEGEESWPPSSSLSSSPPWSSATTQGMPTPTTAMGVLTGIVA